MVTVRVHFSRKFRLKAIADPTRISDGLVEVLYHQWDGFSRTVRKSLGDTLNSLGYTPSDIRPIQVPSVMEGGMAQIFVEIGPLPNLKPEEQNPGFYEDVRSYLEQAITDFLKELGWQAPLIDIDFCLVAQTERVPIREFA